MSRQFKFPFAAELIFYSMLILSNIFFLCSTLISSLRLFYLYKKTKRRNFYLKWKFTSWKFPAGMTVTGYGYETQLEAEFGPGVHHMPVLRAYRTKSVCAPSASCFITVCKKLKRWHTGWPASARDGTLFRLFQILRLWYYEQQPNFEIGHLNLFS